MKRPESMNLSAKACRLLRPRRWPARSLWSAAWRGRRSDTRTAAPSSAMTSCTRSAVAVRCPWAARPAHAPIGVGVGWNSNLICGDMSIQTTLRNQLNGITNGFQQIMSNVIQSATSAVASLPALIIQRADPGLYNLLTNGVLQARLDFDRSKLTCRAMAEDGRDCGWPAWLSQMAEGMALRDAVGSNDAVSAVEQAETRRGNDGLPGWAAAMPVAQASPPSAWSATSPARATTWSTARRDGHILHRVHQLREPVLPDLDVAAAGDRMGRVLGEQVQRTCDSCTKTETVPGVS